MSQQKTKVVVTQFETVNGVLKYMVAELTQRTQPKIGSELTEKQVKELIMERNTTVLVKKSKGSESRRVIN